MKSKVLITLTAVLSIALATSAFSQGRHDEKLHGMNKPSTDSVDKRVTTGSGRHDEKPHGMRKPMEKKGSPAVKIDGGKSAEDTRSK